MQVRSLRYLVVIGLMLFGIASWSQHVVINEFVSLNLSGIVDDLGDRADWVELYNPTGSTVDLQR